MSLSHRLFFSLPINSIWSCLLIQLTNQRNRLVVAVLWALFPYPWRHYPPREIWGSRNIPQPFSINVHPSGSTTIPTTCSTPTVRSWHPRRHVWRWFEFEVLWSSSSSSCASFQLCFLPLYFLLLSLNLTHFTLSYPWRVNMSGRQGGKGKLDPSFLSSCRPSAFFFRNLRFTNFFALSPLSPFPIFLSISSYFHGH